MSLLAKYHHELIDKTGDVRRFIGNLADLHIVVLFLILVRREVSVEAGFLIIRLDLSFLLEMIKSLHN